MKAVKVLDGVYWVGGVDWRLRNFHGYLTQRGSTYNAYLILDEKITLIDTVKHYLYDEMLQRIASVVDPGRIDCLVCNHVEMDHSGSLPMIREVAGGAAIYASPKGVDGLRAHFGDMDIKPVKTGDSVSIGKRTLQFVNTPMVHWPDNMVTFCPEDRILFSNDAFGQHIATPERFADECPTDTVLEEAAKYYANIVLPYGNQVRKALDAVAGLKIETIAPSHGLIWRMDLDRILERYNAWAANETENKALVIYDTMWGSTRLMAHAIAAGFEEKQVRTKIICLQDTHISDIMTSLLTARYVCVGSPTLNNNMLPTVSAFLTYLKGPAPKNRVGVAFGSHGWGGQSTELIRTELKDGCKFEMLLDPVKAKYIPSKETLDSIAVNVAEAVGSRESA